MAFRVTDRGVAELVRACPSLRALSLYWNLNVGGETLTALSETCPQLTRVNLSGCKAVTDLGIVQLAQGCPKLTHVDLTRWVNPLEKSHGTQKGFLCRVIGVQ